MSDKPIGDYEIVNAMSGYGGHFAKAIAEAARRADPENLGALKRAFPAMWDQYREMAERIHARQSAE